MEFGKLHNTTDFCPRQLVTDLLQGGYGETGVIDFGKTCYSELLTCCGLATEKLLRETGVMNFGLYIAAAQH